MSAAPGWARCGATLTAIVFFLGRRPSFYEAAAASGDPDYVGALQQWDANMGRILDVLRQHGVYNDTLVWVTSDNGPVSTVAPPYDSPPQRKRVAWCPFCTFSEGPGYKLHVEMIVRPQSKLR